jgi:hypothetical protein
MNLLKDFYNDFICLNLKDYKNIGIDFEINKLILLFFGALIVGCIIVSINQMNLTLLIRKLMKIEAYSESSAKTLSQLGLADNAGIRSLITKNDGRISKIIAVVGIKRQTYEEYIEAEQKRKEARRLPPAERKAVLESLSAIEIDASNAKIYIPEDKREYASYVYSSGNGSVVKTALSCALILVVAITIVLLMPTLLSAVNGILGS